MKRILHWIAKLGNEYLIPFIVGAFVGEFIALLVFFTLTGGRTP